MEWLTQVKAILDLGVSTALLLGIVYMLIRPPEWIRQAVDSHHQLAQGVRTMSDTLSALPRREEFQELLIGQEALRRETVEVKEEVVALRRVIDGRPS